MENLIDDPETKIFHLSFVIFHLSLGRTWVVGCMADWSPLANW